MAVPPPPPPGLCPFLLACENIVSPCSSPLGTFRAESSQFHLRLRKFMLFKRAWVKSVWSVYMILTCVGIIKCPRVTEWTLESVEPPRDLAVMIGSIPRIFILRSGTSFADFSTAY